MIDRAVAHALVFHEQDDALKGVQVVRHVAVKFNVADVPRVRQRMVWRLAADFLRRRDREVNRDMERVRIEVVIRDPVKLTVSLPVNTEETSG